MMPGSSAPKGGSGLSSGHEGIIIAVNGEVARVRTSRHSDCENCGACPGTSAMVLEAANPLGAKVGQRVFVTIEETSMLKATFITYIMPLVFAAVGAALGGIVAALLEMSSAAAWQIAGGILAFAAAVAIVYWYDKRISSRAKMLPVITEIIE